MMMRGWVCAVRYQVGKNRNQDKQGLSRSSPDELTAGLGWSWVFLEVGGMGLDGTGLDSGVRSFCMGGSHCDSGYMLYFGT
jgi:hypothetical protein